jgi:hypothetical protein
VTELQNLANLCPLKYPLHIDKWEHLSSVIALSAACRDAGYPHLAKAVLGGKAWSRKIANANDEQDVCALEEFASGPAWSWNKINEEPRRMKCKTCGGSGTVEKTPTIAAWSEHGDREQEACQDCNGTGGAKTFISTVIDALQAADTDIGHWCQLATRQYAEMPNASHNPIAPTLAGIEASRKVQRQLMDAVKILRDNHEQEKETSEKPRRTTTQG